VQQPLELLVAGPIAIAVSAGLPFVAASIFSAPPSGVSTRRATFASAASATQSEPASLPFRAVGAWLPSLPRACVFAPP